MGGMFKDSDLDSGAGVLYGGAMKYVWPTSL
jgi:hypothetical protein